MEMIESIANKARCNIKTIVYPEGSNPTILEAVGQLQTEQLIKPVLIGDPEEIKANAAGLNINLKDIPLIQPDSSPNLENFIQFYSQRSDMPLNVSRRILTQPLMFAAMMVKTCLADGMVAGIEHPTEEVILAGELIIGLRPEISVVSSFFLMEIPGFSGGEHGWLIFADPAVNPDPQPEQLADIALATAISAQELLGWQPRIAMLSFSTRGSASHPLVDKVIEATRLAREKAPGLLLEGEIQADAALVEEVARKKINSESRVAGRANILIFPDLNAANISCKLVQRLAHANAYGPILQGFASPVSDLSRGATITDIVGASLLTAARA